MNMTIGVGGKTRDEAMDGLTNMTQDIAAIPESEFRQRLSDLQQRMRDENVKAAYLHASTNLYYFTGLRWSPSERMTAAIVPAEGDLIYVAPNFEQGTLRDYWQIEAEIEPWQEHESPFELVGSILNRFDAANGLVVLDEMTPFFIFDGLRVAIPKADFQHAQPITQAIRSRKSPLEIQIIGRAHEMTLEVVKAAASILRPGISTAEVTEFIDDAHRKVGASGSYFCIVLFGVASTFPHGVKDPQILQSEDWVLIDTGCLLHGYNSDITRSFCYGPPSDEQRRIWDAEKRAQLAAYSAAKIGEPCEVCDDAARKSLEASGYGPDYLLPGLPTRSGHGCGLDIHEGPNLVRGEQTKLATGMVFSCEPMIVVSTLR